MQLWTIIVVLVLGIGCGGCGKLAPEKANARADEAAKVTKWKHAPQSAVGTPYGLIIESRGRAITAAAMYELKEDTKFDIIKKVSHGHTLSKEKKLLLPIAVQMPLFEVSAREWIANGGPHWIVWYAPGATNLLATLNTPGVNKYRFSFVPVID